VENEMTSWQFIRLFFRPRKARKIRVELHYAGRLITIYAAIAGLILWFCICMLICIYGAGA